MVTDLTELVNSIIKSNDKVIITSLSNDSAHMEMKNIKLDFTWSTYRTIKIAVSTENVFPMNTCISFMIEEQYNNTKIATVIDWINSVLKFVNKMIVADNI